MKNCFARSPTHRQPERTSGRAALLLVVFSIVPLLLQGCASSPKKTGPTASTDLLLAEALRQYIDHRDPAQGLAMAQLAVKRAPERADALWILMQICSGASGCQPEPLEAQFRKLDPTNGAVWLGPLNRATQRGNVAEADQILEAIARSQRIDLGWNGLIVKLSTALAERARTNPPANKPPSAPKTPLSDALNDSVGLLSRVALPALQPISESCSSRRLVDRLVAARCLLVGSVLQRSDTYVAESMGLGIMQRLAATDSVETAKVEQRIVNARYQHDAAGAIITGQTEKDRFATELLDLMRKQRREQDVFVAVIRWAGQPLSPAPNR
ncbi:MAG: hypothetical protein ABW106_15140 [Steroidobacteraceae bacterium]